MTSRFGMSCGVFPQFLRWNGRLSYIRSMCASTQASDTTKLAYLFHRNGIIDNSIKSVLAASASINTRPTEGVVMFDSNEAFETFKRQVSISSEYMPKKIHYSVISASAVLAESVAEALSSLLRKLGNISHFICASSSATNAFLPRLGALIDVGVISDVISIESEDTFTRPIFAGNAHCKVRSLDTTKLVTIRPSSFASSHLYLADKSEVVFIEHKNLLESAELREISKNKTTRPELSNAKMVVAGGRALGSKSRFQDAIFPLADALGAAVGATRAAVDLGYISNEYQIGQTGKIVAPQLYLAIGISGAIQHVAGMKDSKTIVSINKDPDAPIFAISDYWMVGDIFEIIPKLVAEIKDQK